eukprot:4548592-Pyramimonas_sp.AAC.1
MLRRGGGNRSGLDDGVLAPELVVENGERCDGGALAPVGAAGGEPVEVGAGIPAQHVRHSVHRQRREVSPGALLGMRVICHAKVGQCEYVVYRMIRGDALGPQL